MYLFQIFLPVSKEPPAVPWAVIRDELTERFGGLTAYTQSPAEGFWKASDGGTSHDKIMVVEVMTGELDTVWWHSYRRELEKRLAQEHLVIRMLEIGML